MLERPILLDTLYNCIPPKEQSELIRVIEAVETITESSVIIKAEYLEKLLKGNKTYNIKGVDLKAIGYLRLLENLGYYNIEDMLQLGTEFYYMEIIIDNYAVALGAFRTKGYLSLKNPFLAVFKCAEHSNVLTEKESTDLHNALQHCVVLAEGELYDIFHMMFMDYIKHTATKSLQLRTIDVSSAKVLMQKVVKDPTLYTLLSAEREHVLDLVHEYLNNTVIKQTTYNNRWCNLGIAL